MYMQVNMQFTKVKAITNCYLQGYVPALRGWNVSSLGSSPVSTAVVFSGIAIDEACEDWVCWLDGRDKLSGGGVAIAEAKSNDSPDGVPAKSCTGVSGVVGVAGVLTLAANAT